MKYIASTLFVFLLPLALWSQTDSLIKVVKKHPVISEGGAEVIPFDGQAYIVGVGFVENKGQSRAILERIGKVKAEKEIAVLINGSDFTSSAVAVIEQIVTTEGNERKVEEKTSYFQTIKENSEGFIHSMSKLASWKSDDKSMFYYAIYKPINIE
ncbi:hypothetical protein ACE01N_02380 [Saccharicrinis sp. FJH2]|uniref:hypothetical protein n=1 Tax=Saccharicrinis sp. FJH65 TaxID=3344659 RepID=UPI0035F3BA5D